MIDSTNGRDDDASPDDDRDRAADADGRWHADDPRVARLADLPPGTELALALATIDHTTVRAVFFGDFIQGWARLRASIEAQMVRLSAELTGRPEYQHCTCPPGTIHRHHAIEPAGDEISLAMGWSPARAKHFAAVTLELTEELTGTLDALADGRLDLEKAILIADRTRCLPSPGLRSEVAAAVLGGARGQTRGQLDYRLRQQVAAADPGGAERRRAAATKGRRVGRPEPSAPGGDDGAARMELVGPAEDLVALWVAVDAAARHAREGGDARTLDQLRFDTMTGLGWTALSLGHLGCCAPACAHAPTGIEGASADPFPAVPVTVGGNPTTAAHVDTKASFGAGATGGNRMTTGSDDAGHTVYTGAASGTRRGADDTTGRATERVTDDTADGGHCGDRGGGPDSDHSGSHGARPDSDHSGSHAGDRGHGPGDDRGDRRLGGGRVVGPRLGKRRGKAATVHVTVAASTLFGADEAPGWLEGFGPITAQAARRISGEGPWHRLLTDPATRRLLEYGRTTYAPPADLAAHAIARDVTCRFPTCQRPAGESEIDHIRPFEDGGTTGVSNVWALHGGHHFAKTSHGYVVDVDPDGTPWWITPAGHSYRVDPEAVGPFLRRPTDVGDEPAPF